MSERWSQRNAWIVWGIASLVGWLAIGIITFLPLVSDDSKLANMPSHSEDIEIKPSSGPDD